MSVASAAIRLLRHVGVTTLAHAAAALSAGGALSTVLLLTAGPFDDASNTVLSILQGWLAISLATAMIVWFFTLPTQLLYPLALRIARSHGPRSTTLVGALVGTCIVLVIWLGGAGPEDYPALTPAEYARLHLGFLFGLLPSGIAAGFVYGSIVARLNGRIDKSRTSTEDRK